MTSRTCVNIAAPTWGSTFLCAVLHTANTFSLPLCQISALDQFFCEIPQILRLSCSDAYLRELWVIAVSLCLAFGCFVFIVLSYVQTFRAVLRIPSQQGRHKAFSTCLPHLFVVSLFISTGTVAYLRPHSISSSSLDLVVAVLYSVVPPTLNPLIYSMRNQELKDSLKKLIFLAVHNFQQLQQEVGADERSATQRCFRLARESSSCEEEAPGSSCPSYELLINKDEGEAIRSTEKAIPKK
ncbi:Olfactory receptor 14A16-like protein [Aix galericulata]|nr:Olfactory receptor 14A16-like protein [Aix galericulata]